MVTRDNFINTFVKYFHKTFVRKKRASSNFRTLRSVFILLDVNFRVKCHLHTFAVLKDHFH